MHSLASFIHFYLQKSFKRHLKLAWDVQSIPVNIKTDLSDSSEQHFHCYHFVNMCSDNEPARCPYSLISLPVLSVFHTLLSCHLHIAWNCSNQSLIYHQNDPQSFYLCLMLFLKLSHKSSRIKRLKRWFSLSPPCISSLPVCRRSCRDARSAFPLDDPLRYVWCQCEQLVFLFSLRFPHLLPLPIMLLISSLVWSAVALLHAGLRGRGARLMASGERVCDIQVWEEAQKVLLSAPIHHPRALITQWWRMSRIEDERVLNDRHVFVAQQKQFNRLLWATFFSTLIYPEEVCGEKMICHSITDHTVKPSSHRNNIISGREVICNSCRDHQLFPLALCVFTCSNGAINIKQSDHKL